MSGVSRIGSPRSSWLREYDDSADLESGFRGAKFVPGERGPNDASYKLMSHDG